MIGGWLFNLLFPRTFQQSTSSYSAFKTKLMGTRLILSWFNLITFKMIPRIIQDTYWGFKKGAESEEVCRNIRQTFFKLNPCFKISDDNYFIVQSPLPYVFYLAGMYSFSKINIVTGRETLISLNSFTSWAKINNKYYAFGGYATEQTKKHVYLFNTESESFKEVEGSDFFDYTMGMAARPVSEDADKAVVFLGDYSNWKVERIEIDLIACKVNSHAPIAPKNIDILTRKQIYPKEMRWCPYTNCIAISDNGCHGVLLYNPDNNQLSIQFNSQKLNDQDFSISCFQIIDQGKYAVGDSQNMKFFIIEDGIAKQITEHARTFDIQHYQSITKVSQGVFILDRYNQKAKYFLLP